MDHKKHLESLAKSFGVTQITERILNDASFLEQSGCAVKIGHHYGKGGLLKHTREVCDLVLMLAEFYKMDHPTINRVELFISALYHDYGKVWDYEFDESTGEFTSHIHKRKIHHISRSAIEWEMVARSLSLNVDFTDRVTHNILSHHCQREFGSPVMPLTREAWILHLCDNMSARVDDCDRIDFVKLKKSSS